MSAASAWLVTTGVEGDPPAGESSCVILAAWCSPLPADRDAVATVPDPWEDTVRLDRARSQLRELRSACIAQLAVGLGALHGAPITERQCAILLGPWLDAYLAAIIDRWERLTLAAEMPFQLSAYALDSASHACPRDTLDAVQLLKDDAYNLQLMSRMLPLLGIHVRTVGGDVSVTPFPGPAPAGAPKRAVRRAAAAVLSAFQGSMILHKGAHLPPAAVTGIAVGTWGRVMPLMASTEHPSCADSMDLRAGLSPLDLGKDPFLAALGEWVVRDMPRCFVEGYVALTEAAKTLGPPPRAILSANAWYYDEVFKRWAASAAKRGTLLLGAQHGGNYGIEAHNHSEAHEREITDRYYSWGWEDERDPRVCPMPTAKLLGVTPFDMNDEGGALLVGTVWWRYPMHLGLSPERFARYLEWQRRFVVGLPSDIAARVRFRPHREDAGWCMAQSIAAARPEVGIEGWQRPFRESMADSQVVVCDHLSTTYVEAMACGKPVILFWDPGFYEYTAAASEDIEELRGIGILYDSPEAAAGALREALEDTQGWWIDSGRQASAARFCERFARTRRDGIAEWTRELAAVISARD